MHTQAFTAANTKCRRMDILVRPLRRFRIKSPFPGFRVGPKFRDGQGCPSYVFIAIVLLTLSSASHAAPGIGNLVPWALKQGGTYAVKIFGVELVDPQDILFYRSGLELVEFEARSPKLTIAHLRVAPDCEPGIHTLRLVTSRGISKMHSLMVTALPLQWEKEPNPSNKPQPISLPRSIQGTLLPEDEDCYTFSLEKGQKVNFEVTCIRISRDFDDPILTIIGPDGAIITESDDDSLTRQDPVIWFTAPEKGRYVAKIRDVMRRGSERYSYVLHVGDFPRPRYA